MNPSLINDATALLAPAKNFESHDRRTWLKTALGMGYAAACVPLCAQTAIRTSSEGLLCGEAMVNVNGFQMPVYRSVPLGKTDCPVVLVVSEIFGVHEYIADITRRVCRPQPEGESRCGLVWQIEWPGVCFESAPRDRSGGATQSSGVGLVRQR
jgi:carboxymethylenebutenolidase